MKGLGEGKTGGEGLDERRVRRGEPVPARAGMQRLPRQKYTTTNAPIDKAARK
jgi:hypothetical protein